MPGWRGAAAGALALVALHTLVQPEAAGRISALFAVPGRIARRFLNPAIPAIPDRRDSESGGSGGNTGKSVPALRGGSGPGGAAPTPRYPNPFTPPFSSTTSGGGD